MMTFTLVRLSLFIRYFFPQPLLGLLGVHKCVLMVLFTFTLLFYYFLVIIIIITHYYYGGEGGRWMMMNNMMP